MSSATAATGSTTGVTTTVKSQVDQESTKLRKKGESIVTFVCMILMPKIKFQDSTKQLNQNDLIVRVMPVMQNSLMKLSEKTNEDLAQFVKRTVRETLQELAKINGREFSDFIKQCQETDEKIGDEEQAFLKSMIPTEAEQKEAKSKQEQVAVLLERLKTRLLLNKYFTSLKERSKFIIIDSFTEEEIQHPDFLTLKLKGIDKKIEELTKKQQGLSDSEKKRLVETRSKKLKLLEEKLKNNEDIDVFLKVYFENQRANLVKDDPLAILYDTILKTYGIVFATILSRFMIGCTKKIVLKSEGLGLSPVQCEIYFPKEDNPKEKTKYVLSLSDKTKITFTNKSILFEGVLLTTPKGIETILQASFDQKTKKITLTIKFGPFDYHITTKPDDLIHHIFNPDLEIIWPKIV